MAQAVGGREGWAPGVATSKGSALARADGYAGKISSAHTFVAGCSLTRCACLEPLRIWQE